MSNVLCGWFVWSCPATHDINGIVLCKPSRKPKHYVKLSSKEPHCIKGQRDILNNGGLLYGTPLIFISRRWISSLSLLNQSSFPVAGTKIDLNIHNPVSLSPNTCFVCFVSLCIYVPFEKPYTCIFGSISNLQTDDGRLKILVI